MLSFWGEMTIFFICIQRFMNIINIKSILRMIYIHVYKKKITMPTAYLRSLIYDNPGLIYISLIIVVHH